MKDLKQRALGVAMVVLFVAGIVLLLQWEESGENPLSSNLILSAKTTSAGSSRPAKTSKEVSEIKNPRPTLQVRDSNFVPVADAQVVLASPNGRVRRQLSDGSGYVPIPVEIRNETSAFAYVGHPRHGAVVVRLSATDLNSGTEVRLLEGAAAEVTVESADGEPVQDLAVVVTSESGSRLAVTPIICELSGHVTEHSGGILPKKFKKTWPRTGTNGKVAIRGLAANKYTIAVYEKGRLSTHLSHSLKAGDNRIRVTLPNTFDIATSVRDLSGSPIAAARSWLFVRQQGRLVTLSRTVSGVDGVVRFEGVSANSDEWEIWSEKNDFWGRAVGTSPHAITSVVVPLGEPAAIVKAISEAGKQLLVREVRATIDGVDEFDYVATVSQAGSESVRLPFVFPDMNYDLLVKVMPEAAVGLLKSQSGNFDGSESTHEVVFEKVRSGQGRGSISLLFDPDVKNETIHLSVQGFRCSIEKNIRLEREEIDIPNIIEGPKSIVLTHPSRGVFLASCEVTPDRVVAVDVKFERGCMCTFELPASAPKRRGLTEPWSWSLITEVATSGEAMVVSQGYGGNGQGIESLAPIGRRNSIVFVDRVESKQYLSFDFDSAVGFNASKAKQSSRTLNVAMDSKVFESADEVSLSYLGGFLQGLTRKVEGKTMTFKGMPPGTFEIIVKEKTGRVISSDRIAITWDLDWQGTSHLNRP